MVIEIEAGVEIGDRQPGGDVGVGAQERAEASGRRTAAVGRALTQRGVEGDGKTAGPAELEAWQWLMEAVAAAGIVTPALG